MTVMMRKWGVYHSLEETLQVLKDESPSVSDVEELLAIFSNISNRHQVHLDPEVDKRHPFIVVEGLDGSGKTTVTKKLASKLNGLRMSTPGPQFLAKRDFFDQQSSHVRRAYYSLCNYAAAIEIREKLNECPVVLDRFWHSTAAYAIAAAVEDVADLPEDGHPIYKWPKDLEPYPDKIFFLKISEDERMRRISGRSTFTPEETRIEKEAKFRALLQESYRRMSQNEPKIIEINANRYPNKVVADLLQKVNDQ